MGLDTFRRWGDTHCSKYLFVRVAVVVDCQCMVSEFNFHPFYVIIRVNRFNFHIPAFTSEIICT